MITNFSLKLCFLRAKYFKTSDMVESMILWRAPYLTFIDLSTGMRSFFEIYLDSIEISDISKIFIKFIVLNFKNKKCKLLERFKGFLKGGLLSPLVSWACSRLLYLIGVNFDRAGENPDRITLFLDSNPSKIYTPIWCFENFDFWVRFKNSKLSEEKLHLRGRNMKLN